MSERITKLVLAVLAINSAAIGLWAAFAPRAFYDNFPGGTHTWIAVDGPYNEHLVRDVGELNRHVHDRIHARRAVTTPSRGSTPRELQSALVGRVISGLGGIRV